jgi:hypothetical protein
MCSRGGEQVASTAIAGRAPTHFRCPTAPDHTASEGNAALDLAHELTERSDDVSGFFEACATFEDTLRPVSPTNQN